MASCTVADVVRLIDELYPPSLAQEWDSVGLIVGDPHAPVRRILVALDPVAAVAREAQQVGADFVLTHHPLYLRGTDSVAAVNGKGRVVHRLIRAGIALMNAHTNADAQAGGVADALADLVGMGPQRRPLQPCGEAPGVGIGRVGRLARATTLGEYARRVARVLPSSSPGLLVAGDVERGVETVAVSGGAGDSLLVAAARAGADCFLTADLRHHPALEHVEDGGPALLCGTHWATEWPWVPVAAKLLAKHCAHRDWAVKVEHSRLVTEAWNLRLATGDERTA